MLKIYVYTIFPHNFFVVKVNAGAWLHAAILIIISNNICAKLFLTYNL